jgi:hypothetical protein
MFHVTNHFPIFFTSSKRWEYIDSIDMETQMICETSNIYQDNTEKYKGQVNKIRNIVIHILNDLDTMEQKFCETVSTYHSKMEDYQKQKKVIKGKL